MDNRLLAVAALLGSVFATPAMTDVISLKNGDRFHGDLVKLEGDSIIWASDSLGNITLAKNKVEHISTETLVKINGHNGPCTLLGNQGEEVVYSCQDSGASSTALTVLESMLPYHEYLGGAHTYRGTVRINGKYSSGNIEESNWDIYSDVEFRRGDYRHGMAVKYERKLKDGSPADEVFNVAYRLDWFFREHWFYHSEIAYGRDEPKSIDERYSLGQGIGYQFWDNDLSALALESGFNYQEDNLEKVVSMDSQSSAEKSIWRLATEFRYTLPLSAELFHKSEMLWSLEESDDWRLGAETGINIPLGHGLHSRVMLDYDYDNLPLEGKRKTDTNLKVGIGYQW